MRFPVYNHAEAAIDKRAIVDQVHYTDAILEHKGPPRSGYMEQRILPAPGRYMERSGQNGKLIAYVMGKFGVGECLVVVFVDL